MREATESLLALATALLALHDPAMPFDRQCLCLCNIQERLELHQQAFGALDERFQQGLAEYVTHCNAVAMRQLASHPTAAQLDACGRLLEQSERATRHASPFTPPDNENASQRVALRLVTFNNLACFFQQIGKPLAAISWLERVLRLQRKRSESDAGAMALTHLNLCAVLSQLERHLAAEEHARIAVTLLARVADDSKQHAAELALLLVAQYNLAVELEHLGEPAKARVQCEAALLVADAHGISMEQQRVVEKLKAMLQGSRPSQGSDRAHVQAQWGALCSMSAK